MRVLLLLFAAAGVANLSGAVEDQSCVARQRRNIRTHWPNPATNCSSYFRCNANNEISEVTCPNKRIYNSATGKCVRRKRGICQLSGIAPQTGDEYLCKGHINGQFVAAPGLCREFYLCFDRLAYLQMCPAGSHFNELDEACVPDKSNINETCWQNVCIGKANGVVLPDPLSCTTYYTCTNEEACRTSCPAGTFFSVAEGNCQSDEDGSQCWQNVCFNQSDNTRLPDLSDCTSYYECQAGSATLKSCTQNMYYDVAEKRCVPGTCSIDTTTEPSITDAPACVCENGKFEVVPENRQLYKVCVDKWIDGDCGAGNYFDPLMNICQAHRAKRDLSVATNSAPTSGIIDSENPDSGLQCLGGFEDGEAIPHDRDCNSFILCSNGMLEIHSCSDGEYFDAHSEKCITDVENLCTPSNILVAVDEHSELSKLTLQCLGGLHEGEAIPHDRDCHSFIICSNGILEIDSCIEGEYFDVNSEKCIPDTNHVCTSSSVMIDVVESQLKSSELPKPTMQCLGDFHEGEMIPHERDCRSYILCSNGILEIHCCSDGEYFDANSEKCITDLGNVCKSSNVIVGVDVSHVQSNEIAEGTPQCLGGFHEGEAIPHERDCHSFIICSNGILEIHSCSDGEYFDANSEKCITDHDNVCKSSNVIVGVDASHVQNNEIPEDIPQCLGGFHEGEAIPHERDCHSFIICSNGILEIHSCSDGEYFDANSEKCITDLDNVCKSSNVIVGVDVSHDQSNEIAEDTPQCLGGFNEGEAIPHERDCHSFIICSNGILEIHSCSDGEYFDANSEKCITDLDSLCKSSNLIVGVDASHVLNSEIPEDTQQCLGGFHEGEAIPHDRECNSFILCSNGMLDIHSCADGEYFDAHFEKCITDVNNVCTPSTVMVAVIQEHHDEVNDFAVQTEPVYQSAIAKMPKRLTCLGLYSENELVPHPSDCRKFEICQDGRFIESDCGLGNYFNVIEGVCKIDTNVTCASNAQSCRGIYREGEKVEHPHDCRKFSICYNGALVEQSCGIGKFYDSNVQDCTTDDDNQCITQSMDTFVASKGRISCLGVYYEGEMTADPEGGCRQYQVCYKNTMHTFDCGIGTYFNSTLGECQLDINNICESNNPTCLGLYYESQKVAHTTECRQFQICYHGELIIQDCGIGRYFNDSTLSCDMDSDNVCRQSDNLPPAKVAAPSCFGIYVDSEIVPHPSDCRKYQVCRKGNLVDIDCGLGNYFSSSSNTCSSDTDELCSSNRPTCLGMYFESQKLKHDTDCQKFRICYEGELITQDCGIGKYFDTDEMACAFDTEKKCLATMKENSLPVPTCMGIYYEDQLVPHPIDCRKYQKCTDKQLVTHDCGQRNYFDGASERCLVDTEQVCDYNRPACLGLYNEGQLVAHPAHCRQFQVCYNGHLQVQDCGIGKYFNETQAACLPDIDQACQHVSQTHISENSCMGLYYEGQIVAHPTECQYFQVCHGGRLYMQDCGSDMFFDSLANSCKLDIKHFCHMPNADTANNFSLTRNCMGKYPEGLLMPHPTECRKFQLCLNDHIYEESCGTGNYFNNYTSTCEIDIDDMCPERRVHKIKLLAVGEGCYGVFKTGQMMPHPLDCSAFFICDGDGVLKAQTCGIGNFFDNKLSICNRDETHTCQPRKIMVTELWSQQYHSINRYADSVETCATCPADMQSNDTMPHATDCKQFYMCTVLGELELFSCPECYQFVYDSCTKTGSCELDTCGTCWPASTNCTGSGGDDEPINPTICTNQTNGVKLPDPTKCNAYYVCQDEIGVEVQCDTGEWFDANATEPSCQPDVGAVCVNPCADQRDDTVLPSPDCSTYFVCKDGTATVENCGKGTGFDMSTGVCRPDATATCFADMCIDEPDYMTYPSYENQSNFYTCQNGTPTLLSCPTGRTYDAYLRVCVTAPSSNCDQSQCNNAETWYTFGTLDDNPTTFCLCNGNAAYEKSCPMDQTYSTTLNICISNLGCDMTYCTYAPEYSKSQNRNDPNSYCLCVMGYPTVVNCPADRSYNAELEICVPFSNVRPVQCTMFPTIGGICGFCTWRNKKRSSIN